jgi:hypothetical protein
MPGVFEAKSVWPSRQAFLQTFHSTLIYITMECSRDEVKTIVAEAVRRERRFMVITASLAFLAVIFSSSITRPSPSQSHRFGEDYAFNVPFKRRALLSSPENAGEDRFASSKDSTATPAPPNCNCLPGPPGERGEKGEKGEPVSSLSGYLAVEISRRAWPCAVQALRWLTQQHTLIASPNLTRPPCAGQDPPFLGERI